MGISGKENIQIAKRRKSAPCELVEWSAVLKERRYYGRNIGPGDVICKNQYGGRWVMSVKEFDRVYQTGVKA